MKILTGILLVFLPALVISQTVETRIDSLCFTPGNQIIVPVRVKNFHNIGSISLVYSYNNTSLTYVGCQNINPVFSGFMVFNYTTTTPHQIRAGWFAQASEVSLPDDAVLFEIIYQYNSGSSSMNWFQGSGYNVYTNINMDSLPSTFQNGQIYHSTLEGYVRYDNIAQSPVNNVKVYARKNNITIDSSLTNSSGHFSFDCLPLGQVSFVCQKYGGWGGANAIDAMLAAQYSLGMINLSGLRLKAADVNNNGGVNSGDALAIMRRFAGLITSFQNADWLFETPVYITVGLLPQVITIKGICTGDVDASFIPL